MRCRAATLPAPAQPVGGAGIAVGDRVRVRRGAPLTWQNARAHGRVGTVASVSSWSAWVLFEATPTAAEGYELPLAWVERWRG